MSFVTKLVNTWRQNNSLVCVGLDPDLNRIPTSIRKNKNPIFEFNKKIVEATSDLVCAFKPQIAHYSAVSAEDQLLMTIEFIKENYEHIPIILDAKRGDIGSTAAMYAKEVFDRFQADAVTVNPFLGGDSLAPFLDRADRGVIILCKTSNPDSQDIQDLEVNGKKIYQIIAELAVKKWNYNNNISLVVGATSPPEMSEVRKIVGEIPLLVPGIGAQGGDIKATIENGVDSKGQGLIINSSRAVLYASSDVNGPDFFEISRQVVVKMRDDINRYR